MHQPFFHPKLPLILLFWLFGTTAIAQNTTINYTPDNANFANPERGFYRYTRTAASNITPLTVEFLNSLRTTTQQTLIFRYFILDQFTNTPISAAFLNAIHADFNTVRQAGFKIIPRFAYIDSFCNTLPNGNGIPPFCDAPLSIVLQHINQLKPVLQQHADVMLTLQNGFWGTWGENYYSDFFGAVEFAPLTAQNWTDRKRVTDSLLTALPTYRTVSLRYPELKATYYTLTLPNDSITLTQAYNGTTLSRLAAHNDCFLVAANDYTFGDTLVEKPYWAAESRYLVMGGETCGDNPTFTNCANTLHEMTRFHWTYCNDYFHPDVITRWQNEGCLETIKRRLGYRLQLTQATLPLTAVQGQSITVSFTLQNTGFAAPVNARNLQLLLRNTQSGVVHTFPILGADPRYWFAGANHTVFATITLPPTLPCGNYDMLLNLPDPQPALAANPNYAMRLANTGTWENATGYNKLLHTLQVQFPLAITGVADACGSSVHTYNIPAQAGATYVWTVLGGSILSGQGTAQITVLWNNGVAGTVSVTQTLP